MQLPNFIYTPAYHSRQTLDLFGTMPMLMDRSFSGFLNPSVAAGFATALMPSFVEAIFKPTARQVNMLHNVYKNTAAEGLLKSTLGQNILSQAMSNYFNQSFNRLGTGLQLLGSLGRVSQSTSPASYLSFLKFLIG